MPGRPVLCREMVFHQFLRPRIPGEQGAGTACVSGTDCARAEQSFRCDGRCQSCLGRARSLQEGPLERSAFSPGTVLPLPGQLPGPALLLPKWPGFLTSFGNPGHVFFNLRCGHASFFNSAIPSATAGVRATIAGYPRRHGTTSGVGRRRAALLCQADRTMCAGTRRTSGSS